MGTRSGQSSMVRPAPSAISLAWPIRPKPVTSVQALGRRGTAARAASRLSAAIRSVIARYSAPLSSSALAAVVRMPAVSYTHLDVYKRQVKDGAALYAVQAF